MEDYGVDVRDCVNTVGSVKKKRSSLSFVVFLVFRVERPFKGFRARERLKELHRFVFFFQNSSSLRRPLVLSRKTRRTTSLKFLSY